MSVIESAVNFAVNIANDDSHGYSQDANKRFAGTDYDCSSLVISAYRQAGVPLTSTFTGNMKQDFLAHGFEDITYLVNLKTGTGIQRGDVLLNETKHTAIALGDNKIVHASSSETGGKYGKEGDQTGTEICIRGYYNRPWDCVLRYIGEEVKPSEPTQKGDKTVMVEVRELYFGLKGADVKALQALLNQKAGSRHLVEDGDFGNNTRSVVIDAQRKFGLVQDGIVGKNTWTALLNR